MRIREDFNLETALQTVLDKYLKDKYSSVFDISYNDIDTLFKGNRKHPTIEEMIDSETSFEVEIEDPVLDEVRTFLRHYGHGDYPYGEGFFVDYLSEIESLLTNGSGLSSEDQKYKFEEILNRIIPYEKWNIYRTNPYFIPLKDKLVQVDRIYFKGEYFGETTQHEKLNWLGNPAQLGYLLNELAEMGYIEFPVTRNERSYSKYAKIALELFNINTTKGNLEKEINPEKCSLSETNKLKLKISNIR